MSSRCIQTEANQRLLNTYGAYAHHSSQYASSLLLSLHPFTSLHNKALITQTEITQNILLPENVSRPRSLNYFVNPLIYPNLLIVSALRGSLTPHCTDEQPPGESVPWVLRVTEPLGAQTPVCQARATQLQ